MKLYHGTTVQNIQILQPYGVGDNKVVYFFSKEENTLVYLANAIERFCKQSGFSFEGKYATWGPYGFDKQKRLCWTEYYPNAFEETFKGASGYIYTVDTDLATPYSAIPFAYTASEPVRVESCRFVADVYQEMLRAEQQGKLCICRYCDLDEGRKLWIEKTMRNQYADPNISADYKYFLENKFPFLTNK